MGYDRLNWVYHLVRSYVNFFQLVTQLQRKTRQGAKAHKVYDTAKTSIADFCFFPKAVLN